MGHGAVWSDTLGYGEVWNPFMLTCCGPLRSAAIRWGSAVHCMVRYGGARINVHIYGRARSNPLRSAQVRRGSVVHGLVWQGIIQAHVMLKDLVRQRWLCCGLALLALARSGKISCSLGQVRQGSIRRAEVPYGLVAYDMVRQGKVFHTYW